MATTALWLVASAGFRVYLEIAADGNPVLGAFGGGAIVMTWAYLLSLALLLGGELNAVLMQRPAGGAGTARPVHRARATERGRAAGRTGRW